MRHIVGLTGLIGSGKTTAGNIFKQLGADIIDTDVIAHTLTAKHGTAIKPLADIFGAEFINSDGSLNRAKMRSLVFSKPKYRILLEQVLHPLIFDQVIYHLQNSKGRYTVIVVPLLFKSVKYLSLIHRSVFIECKIPLLIKRLKFRSGMDSSMIRQVLAVQTPHKLQLLLSDDQVVNDGTVSQFNKQIVALDKHYTDLFRLGKNR